MRKLFARAALGSLMLLIVAAPTRAADVDVAVHAAHYVSPVFRSYRYPPPVYYPRVYAAPVYAVPHCYRSRRIHPDGTVVYRRVCV